MSAGLPQVPTPTPGTTYTGPGLRALALVSPTEGWAVGNRGVIWRYDGTGWQPTSAFDAPDVHTQFSDEALYAVALTAPGEGWAVGGATGAALTCVRQPGLIERLSGGRWTLFSNPRAFLNVDGRGGWSTLRALAMVSPTEGWAVGALVHEKSGDTEAPSVDCSISSYVLHLSGGLWTAVPVPNVGVINGLAFDSPDDGWAAADGGLLHYHAGTWTAVLM